MGAFDEFMLEEDEKAALLQIAEVVLADPAYVDSIVKRAGFTPGDTPEELALQLVHAAVIDPNSFDAAAEEWGDSLDFDWGKIGGFFKSAAQKVGSMFKKKGSTGEGMEGDAQLPAGEQSGGGKVKGFFGKLFGGIKDKFQSWKERRQVKKELKASGAADWKQQWKEYKAWAKGKGQPPSIDEFTSGLPEEEIRAAEQAATEEEAAVKKKKLWTYLGVGLGATLVIVIAIVLIKKKKKAA